jgi:hypothetical protein
VLIVDLPPGTGDVQLTLCQRTQVTGAIVVSTPQDVALLDARKAIDMFNMLKTPILGLIENMSTYICPNCGHEAHIFGHGGVRAEAERIGVPLLGEMPSASTCASPATRARPSRRARAGGRGLCGARRAAGRGRDGLTTGNHGTRRREAVHGESPGGDSAVNGPFRTVAVGCQARQPLEPVLIRDFVGNSAPSREAHLHVASCSYANFSMRIRHFVSIAIFPERDVLDPLSRLFASLFLLITMKSHAIPVHTVNGTTERKTPNPPRAGFIQAPRFIERRDPARERADIPPGGARSRTPSNGTRAADRAVAAARSAVFVPDDSKGTAGQWFGGSEASSTRRWTVRGGCRSRPTSAASSNPATRTGPKANPRIRHRLRRPPPQIPRMLHDGGGGRGRPPRSRPAARLDGARCSSGCSTANRSRPPSTTPAGSSCPRSCAPRSI